MEQQKNCAVFLDIENLTAGYTATGGQNMLSRIWKDITANTSGQRLIIRKAYANWANGALTPMRREVVSLGIDAEQTCGFGYHATKNAADIQMAIDMVETIYTRPHIDTYVMVTGDGGFHSVAKRLREHGKTVIGAAYKSAAGAALQALCDDFVLLHEYQPSAEAPLANPWTPGVRSNPLPQAAPPTTDNKEEQAEYLKQHLLNIAARYSFIHLPAIGQSIKDAIPDFDVKRHGYEKLKYFVHALLIDTPFRLWEGKTGCVVARADRPPAGYAPMALPKPVTAVLPDAGVSTPLPADATEADVARHYNHILRQSGLFCRSYRHLESVAQAICAAERMENSLEGWMFVLLQECPHLNSSWHQKNLDTFIRSGCFRRLPADAEPGQQSLTLDCESPAEMTSRAIDTMAGIIASYLNEPINEAAFGMVMTD